jgi:hypothetical protein
LLETPSTDSSPNKACADVESSSVFPPVPLFSLTGRKEAKKEGREGGKERKGRREGWRKEGRKEGREVEREGGPKFSW